MSAIFGIFAFDGRPVEERELARISSALAHRAVDGDGLWCDGPVGLGHGLMRVTAEDGQDRQPLYDREAGIALVADLRLDNREDLARALGIGDVGLRGVPDSELLLSAYKTWGEDCVQHLVGDFAFAVWEARARKLVLGRDHLGQRNCFFHRGERIFVFASEIKGLWANPDVPRALSEAGIARMLMRDLPQKPGTTPYERIEGLPGATVMAIDAQGTIRSRSYWSPRANPAHERRDESYYVEAYRAVLGEAVACRLRRTAAPAGLLLSGGYDSASIAALAGPVVRAQGRKLVAASSTMPEDYRGTIRHARNWVEMCRRDMAHLDVHHVTRQGTDVFAGLEKRALLFDGRSGPYLAVASALYSTIAACGARVVMDGYGGDQTLNPRGQSVLAYLLASGQLARFAHEMRCHLRMTGRSLTQTLATNLVRPLLSPGLVLAWRRMKLGFAPAWLDLPVNPEFARRMIATGEADDSHAASRKRVDIEAGMKSALARRIAGAGGATVAAAHGLELTQPFYDKHVVELALAVPIELHVKDGRNRYLACRALADLYPREFQTRGRQNDDQIPDFQRMVKTAEPHLLSEIARMEQSETLRSYVDFKKIRRLLAARGPEDHNSGWEEETQSAVGGFVTARYIEWFRGANR